MAEVILTGITGSHAYGTATPLSDMDITSISVERPEEALGIDSQKISQRITDAADTSIYPLRQYLSVVAKGGFNQLEFLYLNEYQLQEPAGHALLLQRRMFSTQDIVEHALGFMRRTMAMSESDTLRGPKDIYHYYRISEMYSEFALTGTLKFPVSQRIIDVRNDTESFRAPELLVAAYDEVTDALSRSELPEKPNRERISQASASIYRLVWDTL